MAKRITKYCTVNNPETNETFTFRPGEVLPEWAESVITNPACFDEDAEETQEIQVSGTGRDSGIFVPDSVQTNPEAEDDDEQETPKPRPRKRR